MRPRTLGFVVTTVIDLHVLQGTVQPQRSLPGLVFFSSILAAFYASFLASHSPITYYAYAFFPVLFWEEVFSRRESLTKGAQALFGHVTSGARVLSLALNAAIYLGVIESLVSICPTLLRGLCRMLTLHRPSDTFTAKSSRRCSASEHSTPSPWGSRSFTNMLFFQRLG